MISGPVLFIIFENDIPRDPTILVTGKNCEESILKATSAIGEFCGSCE